MVVRLVDAAIHDATTAKLQHLRRFVKPAHLPTSLIGFEEFSGISELATEPSGSPEVPWSDPESVSSGYQSVSFSQANGAADTPQQPVLHYLVGPISVITAKDLHGIFSSVESSLGIHFESHLRIIPVPPNPPSSQKQARDWSQEYWPTVYKGGNPYGPHPALVSRALEDVRSRVGRCMGLAKRVGEEVSWSAKGEPIGAVVVDHSRDEAASIVVVAGDARWHDTSEAENSGHGNVMAHAIMRAIGMVARKRRASQLLAENKHDESDFEIDHPLTPLERDVYNSSTLAGDGYLCLDLELYVSHEPCVMCSMAILHSRFSRVVFGQRMLRTGGLTANSPAQGDSSIGNSDRGLGYGLFWRQELNWRCLAWQWIASDDCQTTISSQDIHV